MKKYNLHEIIFLSTPSARRATAIARQLKVSEQFLSTPSARRATPGTCPPGLRRWYFYPRPPRGGRPEFFVMATEQPKISIHALREEGDEGASANRQICPKISIHALREEGDSVHSLSRSLC